MSLNHLLMLVGFLLGVLAWMGLAKALRGQSLTELSADADELAGREEAEAAAAEVPEQPTENSTP